MSVPEDDFIMGSMIIGGRFSKESRTLITASVIVLLCNSPILIADIE